MYQFVLITVAIFISLMMLFQFIRGLFQKFQDNISKHILTALVTIEYFLFAIAIYIHLINPYTTHAYTNLGGRPLGQRPLMINSSIDLLLTLAFILICITAFRHTEPFFSSNTILFFLIGIVCFFLIWGVFILGNHSGPYTIDHNVIKKEEIERSIITIGPISLILMFTITLFRIDKENRIRTVFYTLIPLIIFYSIVFYTRYKFAHLTPTEENFHYQKGQG